MFPQINLYIQYFFNIYIAKEFNIFSYYILLQFLNYHLNY